MIIYKYECDNKIFIDDLIKSEKLKTGDIIIFKAFNNTNSIFTTSYFGHVGLVFIKDEGEKKIPMLFEANGIENVSLRNHHSKKGIFLTPLADRIKKYKGSCFLKPLNRELSQEAKKNLGDFIEYALNEMYYNYNIIGDFIKKLLRGEKCHKGTNCGQIVFLALIKAGLLDIAYYDKDIFHHLKFVINLKTLSNSYLYEDLLQIIDHPFSE